MRASLLNLFRQAITLQYTLPANTPAGTIPRAIISTADDNCLKQLTTNQDIASLIYNGIVEYAYSDYEIDLNSLDNMQLRAFKNKIKYNRNASESTKIVVFKLERQNRQFTLVRNNIGVLKNDFR